MAKKLTETDRQPDRHADRQTSKVVVSAAFCSKKAGVIDIAQLCIRTTMFVRGHLTIQLIT